ncbi:MAG: tetratricopeptide repeat protein, partial [Ferruginibacter sp.]
MKKSALYIALIIAAMPVFAQTEITKANDCYNKEDYQCAVDNYLMALDKKSYKEGDLYLVEYRIGDSYSALKQFDKSNEYLLKAISSRPDYFWGYLTLADNYYDTKKYQEALGYYQKAYDRATEKYDKEDATWWIANCQYNLKNYISAITEFNKLLLRTGRYYKTDAFVGDAFYSLKKYDSAITYYSKAEISYKAVDSPLKLIKCFKGKSYKELGKYKEAIEQLDASIAMDAKYGLPLWEKGIIYALKKEYLNAVEWYKKALPFYSTKPTDAYILCGNISACYQNVNNYAEAVNWEIKKKEYSTNKYKELSKIASFQYGKLNQPKEAAKTCTEGINTYMLEPADKLQTLGSDDYVKLNAIAGKIALEKKDTTQAMKYFETALKLSKGNFEANAGAAVIAWARKNEADLKKYFANIYKSTYDTLISSKKDIANVYGRAAHTDAYINKSSYYSSSVESALKFDSLQKEAVLLWPVVLTNGSAYTLNSNRKACISVLNQAIKQYAADKSYLSDLYNSKAVMLDSKDTLEIRKTLEEAVKVNAENIKAWDNLMKYYGSYNNVTGLVMVEKLITILKKQKDNASTASAYVYKGDFLWRLDKKEDAKHAWKEALIW